MPKIAKPLSNLQVKNLNTPGWHAVGGVNGLLLQVRNSTLSNEPSSRSWILRTRVGNKRSPIGLGPYPQVSLAEARQKAAKLIADAREGIDLVARKRSERSKKLALAAKQKTFQECAESYMQAHSTDYTNDKHRKQWESTLGTYAYPIIGKIFVSDINRQHIVNVLMQETATPTGESGTLWHQKTETAKRLLGRIKTVLDYATVSENRSGANPAIWKNYLSTQLPSPSKIRNKKHHPTVPYKEAGYFVAHLRKNKSISSKALEFLILTAVRSGSVRQAEWSEIDFGGKLWTIPASHTKTKQEHRVPLPDQAIKLLNSVSRIAGHALIFPSQSGKALSDMALSQLMRGMYERGELKAHAVPHGFRSTFRDWAADLTNYEEGIRKAASGHTVGDAVQQAYQRTDLLERRRQLMIDWANFIDTSSVTNENME